VLFGSKSELPATVMRIPAAALDQLGIVLEVRDNQLGEHVARTFLSAWEGDDEQPAPEYCAKI